MELAEMLKKKMNVYHLSGSSEDKIQACEKALGLKFSEDYRKYLSNYSLLSFESHEFTGICDSKRLNVVDATRREWEDNPQIPDVMYLIESIGVENSTVWQNETGEVFEVAFKGNPVKICDSLLEYIEKY